jgi:transcriptional accessory protein Tex/SPT6
VHFHCQTDSGTVAEWSISNRKALGGPVPDDIAPKRLNESLTGVVESAVNYVGVDLNTALPPCCLT